MEKTINVIKITGVPIISSRDVVLLIKEELKKVDKEIKKVFIDFNNIEFISRSAAAALINFKESANKDIIYTGLEEDLAILLRLVAANKIYQIKKQNRPNLKKVKLAELLH